MTIRRFSILFCMMCWALALLAQAPAGYYEAASGKKGSALKTALFAIIADHTTRSYDNLWTDFKTTDMRSDGKVWDMYSAVTNYTFGTDQAGNYKTEGDVYNREHSFPKSWFDDASPMYTDLFHLYPTDGYVNGRRSNYPYGETSNPTWTSKEGWSRLGPCSVAGYTGTVFEPNDEYKGDLARTYFYMATAYEDKISGWNSDMLAGNKYPAYASWAITMLLRWAAEDPVSQKEIDRNNAVYGIQKNRNPYIDYPGLEQYVWGEKKTVAFDPDNYQEGGSGNPDVDPEAPEVPVFSPAGGIVSLGTVVTITTPTEGAYIYYKVNDEDYLADYPPVEITVSGRTQITAYAQRSGLKSAEVSATYLMPDTDTGEGVYVLAETSDVLVEGAKCLIVCESHNVAMAEQGNNIRTYASVNISDNRITTETGESGLPYALTIGRQGSHYTFYDPVGGCYLALTSSDNKLHTSTDPTDADAQWTVSISSGNTVIKHSTRSDRSIQYNASSPRFACYKSAQRPVSLYVRSSSTDGITHPSVNSDKVNVCSLDGRVLRRGVPTATALRGLPPGLYIVGGVKVIVR